MERRQSWANLENDDSWNEDAERYLFSLAEEADKLQQKHEDLAKSYGVYKHILGVPNIIIGSAMAVIGTHEIPDIMTRSMFILSSVLSSLNYYFQYGKRETENKRLADNYSSLAHRIRKTLALHRTKRKSCRVMLEAYTKEMSFIRTNNKDEKLESTIS